MRASPVATFHHLGNMPPLRGGVSRVPGRMLLIAFSVAFMIGTVGITVRSYAVDNIDNIVPTLNYNYQCNTGSSSSGRLCQTDNADVHYWARTTGAHNVSTYVRDAYIKPVMQNKFGANTDLVSTYDTSPTFSGGGETDIIFEQGVLDGNTIGTTWCDDPVDTSTIKCDQTYIWGEGPAWGKDLVCHEAGHAVGLTHGSQAYKSSPPYGSLSQTDARLQCMVTPLNSVNATQNLGPQNTEMINDVY